MTKRPSVVLAALITICSVGLAIATPSPVGAQTGTAASVPHRVTFVNHMDETVWVAASPGNAPAVLKVTGWKLLAGRRLTITVPDHWNGRFWGRTGCHFNAAGFGGCQTGDCDGRLQCTGFGAIPATLAEYDLDSWDQLDFYDVSMVDGSNLPMYINQLGGRGKDPITSDGCSVKGCTRAVVCPPVLQVRRGGRVVGCISACARIGTPQYCCRGKWSSRSACDPKRWPVDYAAVFKSAEPFAYSYVDDDATSVFTCSGSCSYRITFGTTPAAAAARHQSG